jgi:hypothetical protein
MREGKLKSAYGPYRARDLFKLPLNREEGPIWTFDRMGRTHTELPDGRVVCVGGEHEDFYDPDFCIYNDVVVFDSSGQIEIYGYPREVFPPTDFHTATLVGDKIVIVGSTGYKHDRHAGHTPVYTLDLSSYRLSAVQTSGDMPGWISKHEAAFDPEMGVIVRGGEILDEHDGQQRLRRNLEDYSLNLSSWAWRRVSTRNWRQFLIRREDNGLFRLEDDLDPETLVPLNIKHTVLPSQDWRRARFLVKRVPVSLRIDIHQIEVTIEGGLSIELSKRIAEGIRVRAEDVIDVKCVLEQI